MTFWFEVIKYFPEIEIERPEEYVEIKGGLETLQKVNKESVDFTPTI